MCSFCVQILPELKNRFVLKDVDLICWGIIKVAILCKISGIKFSGLKLKLSGFAVKPPPMKELKQQDERNGASGGQLQNLKLESEYFLDKICSRVTHLIRKCVEILKKSDAIKCTSC